MCSSYYCLHTVSGVSNAQQMGAFGVAEMQRYNALIRSGLGTVVTEPAILKIEPEKTVNKKLLLLRK